MELKWYGHVESMSDNRLSYQLLNLKPTSTSFMAAHENAEWTTSKHQPRTEEAWTELARTNLFLDQRRWQEFTDKPLAYL